MRLVLVGPPGSGKGTQAELLTQRLQLAYVGTGDIIRQAIRDGTPKGQVAEPYLRTGQLVPDELVNDLVAELFAGPQCIDNCVFDGYPRTLAQAQWFDRFLHGLGIRLDAVVDLAITDEEVVRRLGGRRVCPQCSAVYHILSRPPKRPGVCDHDGAALITRVDDQEETIRARLQVFHDAVDDLIEHYRRAGLLREVSSAGSVESIYANIVRSLPRPGAK